MYCIAIRLRDLYERLFLKRRTNYGSQSSFSELEEKHSSYHQRKFQTVCFDSGRIFKVKYCAAWQALGRIMTENAGVYTALKSAVKVDTRVSIFYLRSLLVADLSSPAWLPTVGGRGPCLPGRRLSRYEGKFAVFIKSMFQWLKAHWDNSSKQCWRSARPSSGGLVFCRGCLPWPVAKTKT